MSTASALSSNTWPPRSTTRFSPRAPSACFASSTTAASTLLIAGSYTPFCLITLANDGGAVLFFAVWAIAIIGIALECFMRERQPHWVSGLVYLLMGWLVVFKLPELVALLNPVALALLAVGGVCYTAGVPFYIAKNVRYLHSVFPLVGARRQHLPVHGGDPLRNLATTPARPRPRLGAGAIAVSADQRFNLTSRILEVRETPDGHNHLPYHHPRFDPHQRLLLYVRDGAHHGQARRAGARGRGRRQARRACH
ncbi:MAG: PAQR family membrane homeostasis protein TrhA [Collinsella sp.]